MLRRDHPRISDPALLVACFVPLGLSSGGRGQAHEQANVLDWLRMRWEACGRAGMTAAITGVGVPADFPDRITEGSGFRVLATRAAEDVSTGPGPVNQGG